MSNRTAQQIQEAKEKRTTYMREYKRKQYNDNLSTCREDQRLLYHCKKSNIPMKELKQFTVMKSEFTKVLCNMQKIKEQYPEQLREYLKQYLQDL